jgi:hypothetical protein
MLASTLRDRHGSARLDAQKDYAGMPTIRNAGLLWFPFHWPGTMEEGFDQTRDSACNLCRPAAERTQPVERPIHFCSYVTNRSASVVSTTKIASRLAGSVALAFSLME